MHCSGQHLLGAERLEPVARSLPRAAPAQVPVGIEEQHALHPCMCPGQQHVARTWSGEKERRWGAGGGVRWRLASDVELTGLLTLALWTRRRRVRPCSRLPAPLCSPLGTTMLQMLHVQPQAVHRPLQDAGMGSGNSGMHSLVHDVVCSDAQRLPRWQSMTSANTSRSLC